MVNNGRSWKTFRHQKNRYVTRKFDDTGSNAHTHLSDINKQKYAYIQLLFHSTATATLGLLKNASKPPGSGHRVSAISNYGRKKKTMHGLVQCVLRFKTL